MKVHLSYILYYLMNLLNERYLNVLKRLYNTNRFKQKKVNLESISRACELFGNPQNDVPYIHVTGTNGKGSVCKKISSVLINGGFKTGLFISPHITTFRERIQINNSYIEIEYLSEELERIFKVCDSNMVDLTYFELVTLLGFNYFRDMKAQVAVMEVGLGGNLDATNVIDPLLSIITSIGIDHTDSLGFRQEEIAEKKAGIIKPNRPVMIGFDCYPRQIFEEKARENNSPLYIVDKVRKNKDEFFNYDIENREIAAFSINILKKYYPMFRNINDTMLQTGLSQTQPCRKENVFNTLGRENIIKHIKSTFSKDVCLKSLKALYLDVGHNQHGLEKLFLLLREQFPTNYLRVVFGVSASKDKSDIIKTVLSHADKLYLISPDHPRAMKYDELKDYMNDFLINFNYSSDIIEENDLGGKVSENIIKAIVDSDRSANKDEIILICGSFFFMKEARYTLGYSDECDPYELNEINPIRFNVV
jgi:dihydrofolate synthase/folylpolyglutamate synthase